MNIMIGDKPKPEVEPVEDPNKLVYAIVGSILGAFYLGFIIYCVWKRYYNKDSKRSKVQGTQVEGAESSFEAGDRSFDTEQRSFESGGARFETDAGRRFEGQV